MNTANKRPSIVAENKVPIPVDPKVPLRVVMFVISVPPVAATRAVRIRAPRKMFIYFFGSIVDHLHGLRMFLFISFLGGYPIFPAKIPRIYRAIKRIVINRR